MEAACQSRRVTVRTVHPVNLLFERLLEQWKKEASENGRQSQFTYAKALKSLKKFPLELKSGEDALVLEGFGKGICQRLDDELRDVRARFGTELDLTMVEPATAKRSAALHKPSVGAVKRVRAIGPEAGLTALRQPVTADETGVPRIGLPPGGSEILLVVDFAEKAGKTLVGKLESLRVPFVQRRLSVGDFVWIARCPHARSPELLLDFVVERKRLDDLAHSICGKDNRYRDQKARLRECKLANRIFLVELAGNAKLPLPVKTLKQAMINTQIHEDFQLKVTDNALDTAVYLSVLTRKIQQRFGAMTLIGSERPRQTADAAYLLDLERFQKDSVKTPLPTAGETFQRLLMTVRSMTAERAQAIQSRYSTLNQLLLAFSRCPDENSKEALLSESDPKKIRCSLSKLVAELFSK